MDRYVIIPGHGKMKVGSEYYTYEPGKGRVKKIVTYPGPSHYDKAKAKVYAAGCKSEIEQFHAYNDPNPNEKGKSWIDYSPLGLFKKK